MKNFVSSVNGMGDRRKSLSPTGGKTNRAHVFLSSPRGLDANSVAVRRKSYAECPLSEEAQKVVEQYRFLVRKAARRYVCMIPAKDFEELQSYLTYALCTAVARADINDEKLERYLAVCLSCATKQFFRDCIRPKFGPDKLNRRPMSEDEETLKEAGIDPEVYHTMMLPISLDTPTKVIKGLVVERLSDRIPDLSTAFEDIVEGSEVLRLIYEQLTWEEKLLCTDLMYDVLEPHELAKLLSMTVNKVRLKKKRLSQKLRNYYGLLSLGLPLPKIDSKQSAAV